MTRNDWGRHDVVIASGQATRLVRRDCG